QRPSESPSSGDPAASPLVRVRRGVGGGGKPSAHGSGRGGVSAGRRSDTSPPAAATFPRGAGGWDGGALRARGREAGSRTPAARLRPPALPAPPGPPGRRPVRRAGKAGPHDPQGLGGAGGNGGRPAGPGQDRGREADAPPRPVPGGGPVRSAPWDVPAAGGAR